mmetsp:Transcript_91265/g.293122  ORF Transcript_91265/g.293122 Transcript_91265/m.293122 type:complete len:205 (+) Transcript_91265:780-1394(+)
MKPVSTVSVLAATRASVMPCTSAKPSTKLVVDTTPAAPDAIALPQFAATSLSPTFPIPLLARDTPPSHAGSGPTKASSPAAAEESDKRLSCTSTARLLTAAASNEASWIVSLAAEIEVWINPSSTIAPTMPVLEAERASVMPCTSARLSMLVVETTLAASVTIEAASVTVSTTIALAVAVASARPSATVARLSKQHLRPSRQLL